MTRTLPTSARIESVKNYSEVVLFFVFVFLVLLGGKRLSIYFIFQLQDFEEQQARDQNYSLSAHFENSSQSTPPRGRDHQQSSNGFVVQGGPWEQQAPNTASVTDFPAFGRNDEAQSAPATIGGAWGARR